MREALKNLPAMQETRVRFLGREDPLKKETATHSSIIAWKIPWTEEPGRLQSMGLLWIGQDLATKPPPPVLYLATFPEAQRHKYDSLSLEDLQKVIEINVYINKLPYREG